MSKNTGAREFRNVDVDDLDEDKYQDEVVTEQNLGPDEQEVNSLLMAKKNTDALKLVLNNAPIGADKETKEKAASLVTKILTSFKSSEMDSAVKSLNPTQIDILMKYIYLGFSTPTDGVCASLLAWHEKAFAAGGLGSIVRVLTDRKKLV